MLTGFVRKLASFGIKDLSCALCTAKPTGVCVTCRKRICASCATTYRNNTICKNCVMTVSQDVRPKKLKETKETGMSKEEIETGLFGDAK